MLDPRHADQNASEADRKSRMGPDRRGIMVDTASLCDEMATARSIASKIPGEFRAK
jgi:hypothetical protein